MGFFMAFLSGNDTLPSLFNKIKFGSEGFLDE